MKKTFTIFCLFLLFSFSFLNAQPLNSSFEDWTNGDPTDWLTSDVNGFAECVTQSLDAQNGSYSARLEVIDIGGNPYAPILTSSDINGNGHPVSQRFATFSGYYKFAPMGSDWLIVSVVMSLDDNTYIGGGELTVESTASSWTEFDIPIYYISGETPTETHILIIIGDTSGTTSGTIGSAANIDNLSFSGTASVEQISQFPSDFWLGQNYPNPFNPSTNIEYSIPEASFVQLKVYDILGNEVETLVSEEQSAGVYRADFTTGNLASGFYFAQLKAGNFVKTIKMTLLK